MNRRDFLGGSLAVAFCTAMPLELNAQSQHYTIDNYPYTPDRVSIPRFGIWKNINMDVSLLNPETGDPTIGFYASLDRYHGEPFGFAWRNTYRHFMGSRSVHDQDRGAMIQIVNHIRTHAVTADQFAEAYHIAKNAWDRDSALRLANHVSNYTNNLDFG